MKEIFKDIPGYEGLYQVSNTGKVLGLKRNKELSSTSNCSYYIGVNLCKKGKTKPFKIHRLVMLTFVGESDLQVNHIDGDKTNNRLDNLEYVTESQNTIHAYKLGLMPDNRGENAGRSKLKEEQVVEIRELRQKGLKLREIAKIYNVCIATIGQIVNRNYWTNI